MNRLPETNGYETVRSLGSRGPFDLEVAWPKTSMGIEQTVLLKRLRRGWQVHPDDVSAFVADSQALTGVIHSNILEVIDAGSEDGRLFLVNEYIHGVTLYSLLHRLKTVGGGLRLALILEIIMQAAAGLAKAADLKGYEGHGLIHGALGEEFVLLDFSGSVKIADFGVYRLFKTRQALVKLPLDSISPEQKAGVAPTCLSDLYALGVLADKMISQVAAEDETKPGLDKLRTVTGRLLQTTPNERPAGAEQVVLELSRLADLFGESQDAALVGVFLRRLFGGTTKRDGQNSQDESSPGVGSADDTDLLDPGQFWSAAGRIDDESRAPAQEPEVEDEMAEVVSPRPSNSAKPLFPKVSQVLPGAVSSLKTSSSKRPSIPALSGRIAIPIGQRRKNIKVSGRSRIFSYLIGVSLLCLAVLLAWWMLFVHTWDDGIEQFSASNKINRGQAHQPILQASAVVKGEAPTKKHKPDRGKLGSLKITSDPPGVAVFINGEKHGATPTRIPDLQLNTPLSISLEMDGFRTWSQTITLDRRNPLREIHAGLLEGKKCDHGSGWIYVSSKPPGATVEIDGKRLPGKTPLIIDKICADVLHNVRVRLVNYDTWWKDVTPKSGRVLNLKVDLKK